MKALALLRAQLSDARLTIEQTDDDAEFVRALALEARCLLELEALEEREPSFDHEAP